MVQFFKTYKYVVFQKFVNAADTNVILHLLRVNFIKGQGSAGKSHPYQLWKARKTRSLVTRPAQRDQGFMPGRCHHAIMAKRIRNWNILLRSFFITVTAVFFLDIYFFSWLCFTLQTLSTQLVTFKWVLFPNNWK